MTNMAAQQEDIIGVTINPNEITAKEAKEISEKISKMGIEIPEKLKEDFSAAIKKRALLGHTSLYISLNPLLDSDYYIQSIAEFDKQGTPFHKALMAYIRNLGYNIPGYSGGDHINVGW